MAGEDLPITDYQSLYEAEKTKNDEMSKTLIEVQNINNNLVQQNNSLIEENKNIKEEKKQIETELASALVKTQDYVSRLKQIEVLAKI